MDVLVAQGSLIEDRPASRLGEAAVACAFLATGIVGEPDLDLVPGLAIDDRKVRSGMSARRRLRSA